MTNILDNFRLFCVVPLKLAFFLRVRVFGSYFRKLAVNFSSNLLFVCLFWGVFFLFFRTFRGKIDPLVTEGGVVVSVVVKFLSVVVPRLGFELC